MASPDKTPLSAADAELLYRDLAEAQAEVVRLQQERDEQEEAKKNWHAAYYAEHILVERLREALPPAPDQVPQWGIPDYQEAIRKLRRVVASPDKPPEPPEPH